MVSSSVSSGLITVKTASLHPSTTVVSPKNISAPSSDASATISIAFDEKLPSSSTTNDSSAVSEPVSYCKFNVISLTTLTDAEAVNVSVYPFMQMPKFPGLFI